MSVRSGAASQVMERAADAGGGRPPAMNVRSGAALQGMERAAGAGGGRPGAMSVRSGATARPGKKTRWARALPAGLLAAAFLAAGCAPSGETGSGPPPAAAGNAADPAPAPLVLPGLAGLDPAVQDQIRARHAALLAAGSGASAAALADAYGALGLVLQAAGFHAAAEDAYLHAQARAPDAARWPYYLAHLYQLTGERGRALEHFRRVVDLDPENLPALVWLGEMHLDQGRPAAAERVLDRALALQPASAAVLAGLGRAALARGEAARAVTYLERALAVDPAATSLHYSLGMAYRDLGRLERAEQYLRRRGGGAPALPDPLLQESTGLLDSALAHERRGSRALSAGRHDEAAAAFRAGLALRPDDPTLRHRLGVALSMAGDVRGAAAQFEAALAEAPDLADAHFSLGELLVREGRHGAALAHYRSAVASRPAYVDARMGLADTLSLAGRLADAEAEFERAAEIDPAADQAWMGRGVALIQLGRHREARDWLGRAQLVHPGHPLLTNLLLRVLAAAPDAAVRDGERALALLNERLRGDTSIETYETAAMVFAEVGRFDEAATWQRRAIAAAQEAGQAPRARGLAANLTRYEQGRPSRSPL